MTKKINFKTLGCRLNQFETDALASQFHKHGYEIVGFDQKADISIINTCTVTNQSDHKSRNLIRQASRKTDSNLVIVTGCMVNNHKEELEKAPYISYIVENDKKNDVFNLVDSHLKGEIIPVESLKSDVFGYGLTEHGFHTRSMIKIQDGCDNFCSFCIVPKVRGRATSRPSEDVINNIKKVIDAGFKEVVLTGVNIGRYSDGLLRFESLVEKILDISGDFRVRISSIEPDGFSDRFFELFTHPKLTPHLHLCLQSGSENILLKMRRMYTARSFQEMTDNLRSRYPDFNLTTDIIVGFPGESENDFEDSCSLVKDIGFSHIHTFKYSVREGTRAARLSNQVSENIKNERSEIIRQLSLENRLNYFSRMLKKEQVLLTEKPKNGVSRGYGQHYIPIQINHNFPSNTFLNVRLSGISNDADPVMIGELV